MWMQMTLAARYLGGRKLRSFLTTLAIVFGVLVIFGLNTIMPTFVAAFQANALAMAGQTDVTITSKTGEPFSGDLVTVVAGIEGVRALSGSLERTVNLPADYFDADPAVPDAVSALALVGIDPETAQAVSSYPIQEGRFLQARDEAVAVISESLAEAANVKLSGVLTVPSATGKIDLTIVGILPQRLMPGNEEVLVTLPEAQKLLDMPDKINVIEANFNTADEGRRGEIQSRIEAALGQNFKIGALAAGSELLANIRLGTAVLNILAVMGLLMGGFIIFNTFRTVVAERRRDLGMLRAVGASRGAIMGLILAEGIVQGVVGTAAGLLLGYGLGVLVIRLLAPMLKQFLNLNIGDPQVSAGLVIGSIAMGIGVSLFAGWLPARSAGRVTPLEALRPLVGEVSIKRMAGLGFWSGVAMIALALAGLVSGNSGFLTLGGFLFVLGLILIAPALVQPIALLFGELMALMFARNGTAQLAEGNLSRQPTRAAVTASTTMIALAIVVMAASLVSSIAVGFMGVLKKSLGSDFLLVPPSVAVWGTNVGAAPQLAEDLRGVDGVQVVSTLRFAATQINDVPVSLLGVVPDAYTQTGGLTFSAGNPATAYREVENGRGMIMNGIGAKSAGVNLGEEVTLLTPTGQQTYTVVGIATDYLNAKVVTGYISQDNIAEDFGRTEDVFLQINLKPGADRAAVEAQFKEIVKQYPQFRLISGPEFYDQNKDQFDAAFAGLYAMLVFMAIPSLIAMVNTLAIGVIERTREIGMLRAVGATRTQVRTIVVAEALILASIGTAFGLLSGLYLGYMTAEAIATIGFPMVYAFPASGVIAGIAIGLLFGAMAAIIPARQAARMDIVQALRYE